MSAPKKVVLAYSGGLDTSIILKWLQTEYGCEVVTFTADLGQGEELEPARAKAEMLGVKEIYIEDLREEFVRDFVFPMFRANAVYEGLYLLGTSIARPLISKRLVEIAAETGADARGPRRDRQRQRPGAVRAVGLRTQPRYPRHRTLAGMGAYIANETDRNSPRSIRFPSRRTSAGKRRFSVDANLLHTSSEGKALEDPAAEGARLRSTSVRSIPRTRRILRNTLEVSFEKGDPVAINGHEMPPAAILTNLNEVGGRHGVGRLDLRGGPVRRHEVPRHLRDPWRDDPSRSASRHRTDHSRSRRCASEG